MAVDKENGIIFKDDTVIDTLKHPPTELMIGSQNRTKDDDDESVENDVILNRRITSGKCRMSCGHFTCKLKIVFFYIHCLIHYAIDRYLIIRNTTMETQNCFYAACFMFHLATKIQIFKVRIISKLFYLEFINVQK